MTSRDPRRSNRMVTRMVTQWIRRANPPRSGRLGSLNEPTTSSRGCCEVIRTALRPRIEAEGGRRKAEWRTRSSGNAALQNLLAAWLHRERRDEVIEIPEVERLGGVRDGPLPQRLLGHGGVCGRRQHDDQDCWIHGA